MYWNSGSGEGYYLAANGDNIMSLTGGKLHTFEYPAKLWCRTEVWSDDAAAYALLLEVKGFALVEDLHKSWLYFQWGGRDGMVEVHDRTEQEFLRALKEFICKEQT